MNQVILSNASHRCKYFYKHTGCAKKVADRVLMTMLGNLFIELGYLGPFEQNATFLEHPVYIYIVQPHQYIYVLVKLHDRRGEVRIPLPYPVCVLR